MQTPSFEELLKHALENKTGIQKEKHRQSMRQLSESSPINRGTNSAAALIACAEFTVVGSWPHDCVNTDVVVLHIPLVVLHP